MTRPPVSAGQDDPPITVESAAQTSAAQTLIRDTSAHETPAVTQATGTAHAKVILVGEHAVVYGGPAIALPVPELRLTATVSPRLGPVRVESPLYTGSWESIPAEFAAPATAVAATLDHLGAAAQDFLLRVDGAIPPSRGLGSSAAVAAAITQALARAHGVNLMPEERFALVQTAERVAHGNPSGLDAHAVAASGPIWFQDGRARPLDVSFGGTFLIADTGERGGTREAVAAVARLRERDGARTRGLLGGIDAVTREAEKCLVRNDPATLGELMSAAHTLLTRLTVSSPALDRLVRLAQDAGALGAKLTGGGRGGCVLVLAADTDAARHLGVTLQEAGATTWLMGALRRQA